MPLIQLWSARLGEPDITRENDGTTTITASIADQAQLHGLLAGLRDIGAVITELRTNSAPTCQPLLEHPLHTERLNLVLDPAHTGHGYATEAARELLCYCFQDLGVRRGAGPPPAERPCK